MKKITTTNDGYYVIEENPTEPVLEIEEIEYADKPYLKYDFVGWGGSAIPIEREDEFIDSLGRSVRWIKENGVNGGWLG
jgi:hypothetical protein